MSLSNINVSMLPVIKIEWRNQLDALHSAKENASNNVTDIQRQISSNTVVATTLKPQLEKAQLAQWEAVQKYNSFIESGGQLLKVATDAEAQLKKADLSLLERSQLEVTRDTMINLASEFLAFKSQNSATLQILGRIDIGAKSYFGDGRVEWNTSSVTGLAGKVWDDTKTLATGIKEALLKGPFTTEENYAICQSAMSALLPSLAGKILKNPGAGIPDIAYDEVLSNAINAADPGGAMCRVVYRKGQGPQELWRLGQVIEITDPVYGAFTAVLVSPQSLADAALYDAFNDPQVQGLWSSDEATRAMQRLSGKSETPFLDVPDSLGDISALAPVWDNPQWGIQLASASGLESDAGSGLYPGDLGSSVYSLTNGELKALVGKDGSSLLLGHGTADDLKFGEGNAIYIPQRMADGSTTYHYGSGVSINSNAVTGEYHMVLANTDGGGGQTVYSRSVDAEAGYVVKQIQTNAAGAVVFDYLGFQESLSGDIRPISSSWETPTEAGHTSWGVDGSYTTHTTNTATQVETVKSFTGDGVLNGVSQTQDAPSNVSTTDALSGMFLSWREQLGELDDAVAAVSEIRSLTGVADAGSNWGGSHLLNLSASELGDYWRDANVLTRQDWAIPTLTLDADYGLNSEGANEQMRHDYVANSLPRPKGRNRTRYLLAA